MEVYYKCVMHEWQKQLSIYMLNDLPYDGLLLWFVHDNVEIFTYSSI